MSTRSRAHPWFAVDLEQRLAWSTPGGFVCEHGTFIDPRPWSGGGCFICDMEKAYGTWGGGYSQHGHIPTGLTTVEMRDGEVTFTSAPPPPKQCAATRDPFGEGIRCESRAAWPSIYCDAHYPLETQGAMEDVRYVARINNIAPEVMEREFGKLPSWREMLPIAQRIYQKHAAGCCWHVVLDDQNIDDDSVEFCAKNAVERIGECDTGGACLELIPLMRRASKTQRKKLADGGHY